MSGIPQRIVQDVRIYDDDSGARTQRIRDVNRKRTNDQRSLTEATFPLSVLLAEDVTSERTAFRGLAACGDFKPLLDSLVRFLLGHVCTTVLLSEGF
jgi:hypothetical protein